MVDVHKDFCGIELARATLCANRGGRCVVAARFLCDSCGARAALCGDRRGRDAKTAGVFWNFQLGRATLCGDRACRIALAMVPCESSRFARDPLRGLRVLDRSRLNLPGLRAIVRWDQAAKSQPFKNKSGTRSASRQLRLKSCNFLTQSCTRSTVPQLPLQSRKVEARKGKVHREMHIEACVGQVQSEMHRSMHRESAQ